MIESLSAITLFTRDMKRSVAFYEKLGFKLKYGGGDADFSSFFAGSSFLNLMQSSPDAEFAFWGRAIFHVTDVDSCHAAAVAAGLQPSFAPRDAAWGERYFHLLDPDGHEISLARPLDLRPDRL